MSLVCILTATFANYGDEVVLLYQEAHSWLHKAIASAGLEGSQSTDKQVAQTKLQLGSACWELGEDSEVRMYALWQQSVLRASNTNDNAGAVTSRGVNPRGTQTSPGCVDYLKQVKSVRGRNFAPLLF